MSKSFWATTSFWGIAGLLSISVLSPEFYHDYWLGWFGTQAVLGLIACAYKLIYEEFKKA